MLQWTITPKSSMPVWSFPRRISIDKVKGRIEHSTLGSDSKHPILLPPKHPFVDRIISDTHARVKHSRIRNTLTTIRERFWVLRGRQAVKQVLRKCVVCRRAEGVPFPTPPSPDLPPERVSDAPPFVNTRLDFVGPLFIRRHGTDSLSSEKVYILLFTCASTRGVHLELTPTLSVSSFLCAFRRFVGRRGLPSRLLSDNAKTFKAASKEIMKLRSIIILLWNRLSLFDEQSNHMVIYSREGPMVG